MIQIVPDAGRCVARDAFAIAIATPGPPVDGLDGRMVRG
jgi:hypothetical protein